MHPSAHPNRKEAVRRRAQPNKQPGFVIVFIMNKKNKKQCGFRLVS